MSDASVPADVDLDAIVAEYAQNIAAEELAAQQLDIAMGAARIAWYRWRRQHKKTEAELLALIPHLRTWGLDGET